MSNLRAQIKTKNFRENRCPYLAAQTDPKKIQIFHLLKTPTVSRENIDKGKDEDRSIIEPRFREINETEEKVREISFCDIFFREIKVDLEQEPEENQPFHCAPETLKM